MKKRLSAIFLALGLMASVLTGCGGKTEPEKEQPSAPAQSESKPEAEGGITEKIELSLGHGQTATCGPGLALQAYADAVKEASDGMIEITVYPSSQLGGERDLMEGMKMGTVDMAYISSGVVENSAPSIGALNLPFIFDNYDHLEKVLRSDVIEMIRPEIEANAGVKLLTVLNQGLRYTYSTKPLNSPADITGLKIRVPEAPMNMGIMNALGANPTPVAWGELYTAMSTKMVDAFEVQLYSVPMDNLQEVFQYAYLTGHMVSSSAVMFSSIVWDALPAEAQEILLDNQALLEEENNKQIVGAETEQFAFLKESGIEIVEVSEADHNAMRDACDQLVADWVANVENGEEMVAEIESLR